jgi:FkbM family methyltransferase
VIVEPNPGGHRFESVAHVAALASEHGPTVLLTMTGATDREEFRVHLAEHEITTEHVFTGPAPSAREMAARVADACRRHDTATVAIMDGDKALKTWWLHGARELRGLPRRPRVVYFLTHYPARLEITDLPHWRLRIAKGTLVALAMATGAIDRASGFAGRDEMHRGWLVKRARDPAICRAHSRDRAALRAELGLPADRRLVGIFGGVNVRKNPPLVLDAVLGSGLPADLLMAGPVDEDTREWLQGLAPEVRARVILAEGFHPNEMLDRYIAASDVVALLMRLEGPSGIQGKALAAGVPVVTAGSRTRERELKATGGGVSTQWDAASIAHGIREVLTTGRAVGAGAENLMPTAESFAATILGTGCSSGPGRLGHLRERLRNRAAREFLRRYLRPSHRADLVRLGSDYGGWWVPAASVRREAVAYCAGAGEDITFDLALHERGCAVTTFDPTPRAATHVQRVAPKSERFRFVPVGWWHRHDKLRFYSPRNPRHVSHSVLNLQGTSDYFVAEVKPVHQFMAELGDERVDIVKMDIEGAEYRTLDSLLQHGPLPGVLCIEFDQPQPVRKVLAAVRRVQRAGYTLNRIEAWNYTFTR